MASKIERPSAGKTKKGHVQLQSLSTLETFKRTFLHEMLAPWKGYVQTTIHIASSKDLHALEFSAFKPLSSDTAATPEGGRARSSPTPLQHALQDPELVRT